MLTHKDCGGKFRQWIAGGWFCYLMCDKCGHYLFDNTGGEKTRKKIRQAVGGCKNFCCRPHLV